MKPWGNWSNKHKLLKSEDSPQGRWTSVSEHRMPKLTEKLDDNVAFLGPKLD